MGVLESIVLASVLTELSSLLIACMVAACMSLETVDMLTIVPITVSYPLSECKQNQKAWFCLPETCGTKRNSNVAILQVFLMRINSHNIKTEHWKQCCEIFNDVLTFVYAIKITLTIVKVRYCICLTMYGCITFASAVFT